MANKDFMIKVINALIVRFRTTEDLRTNG